MARPSMPRRRGRRRGGGFGERPRHRRIAQPLVAYRHDIATLRDESIPLEQWAGRIAGIGAELFDAARLRNANQRIDQRRAYAASREGGVDVEHVERRGALKAGE